MASAEPAIYLASASPRRSELLRQIDITHVVRPVAIDESPRSGERPAHYALRLAVEKAQALWQRLSATERRPVLAADTTVALDDEILGKPADHEDAVRILGRLSGRVHEVHTAVAVLHEGGSDARVSTSTVEFRTLTRREIDWYWRTGEPADKAGAYGVQGHAAIFIRHLAGSYSGVMGLPLYETWELLSPALGLNGRNPPGIMTTEMIVNVSPRETRAALLENGVLQELFVERASRLGLTGNLYKGRVSRVLPGMQAAFIDIGLERTAFLHVSDIVQPADAEGSGEETRTENIRELVSEGGDILVQVLKDPLGTKGARLTTFITIPSRYLVYMPFGHGVGISARIETEEERLRLRELMQSFVTPGSAGGYIVRTAAEGASADALRADMLFLRKLWEVLSKKAAGTRAGSLVHEDLPLPLRLMRDLVGEGVDRVLVDQERTCDRMQEFATTFMPEHGARVERYTGSRPIFDLHGVEEEIQRSLERKVPLKSGGYLIIDQTEALTTIDVNTGAYVGHRNLEETIYRTNLEAAVAIARQLRLRNLGGIIIIDYIDMQEEEHRKQVLQALEKALAKDHARTHVSAVSPLGLVEMTRKRTRESLAHQLCAPCPACEGRGFVKTPETVCYEIFREVLRQAGQFDFQQLMVLAHSDVIERLLDEESAALGELEVLVGKPIRLQTESLYLRDQYDVVLM